MKVMWLGVVMVWMCGCSALVPSERQQSQSVKASEAIATQHDLTIRRALETGPEMAFRIGGTNDGVRAFALPAAARETLEITSTASGKAGASEAASGSLAVSIPLGVKLGLLGIGLLVVYTAVKRIWQAAKTTAIGQGVSQGLKVADGLVGNYIQGWETHAQSTTDVKDLAEANAEIAELQKMRGKLKG